jgi:tripartite-type tricarboxylate transporter receptor subunit TctC
MPVANPRPARPHRPRAALHYLRRRRVVAASLAIAARPASAQAPWPQRPVRLVVSTQPGTGVDIAARLLARRWSATLGQPVVVDNRGGANGSLAMDSVARAGDGHTLLFANTGALAINNELFATFAHDSLRDFAAVGLLVQAPYFFAVARHLPVATLVDFVDYARAHPRVLNFGSAGIGSLQHLAFEQFRRALGLDIAHVPYRGMADAFRDLAGGRLDVVLDGYPGTHAAEKAGGARIVAVTSSERVAWRFEVPTVAEAAGVPGYAVLSWLALMAPVATPEAIRATMEAALAAALREGELPQALEQAGVSPRFLDGAATRAFIAAERARYGALIREAGIKPDGS